MKKRYLALALAAVLAVCAAGCGKEEAKDDSNKRQKGNGRYHGNFTGADA